MKILFYIPAHESNECLRYTIDNINKYVKNCSVYFCVHINPIFTDFDKNLFPENNILFTFIQKTYYSKWECQLNNIIQSYYLSKTEFGDFDFIAIFHTSQLFCKYGFDEYIETGDKLIAMADFFLNHKGIIPDPAKQLINTGFFNKIFEDQFNYDNYVSFQIERALYSSEVLEYVFNEIEHNLPLKLEEYQSVFPCSNMEELILPTLAYKYCTIHNYPIKEGYTKLYFDIYSDFHLEDYEFAIKSVPRNMDDIIRLKYK